jgi:hypothetical protein
MRFERRFWVPVCNVKQYCVTVSNLHLFLSHLKHSQDSLQVVGGLYRHAEAWKLHVDKNRCFSELTRHSSLRMKSMLSFASSRFRHHWFKARSCRSDVAVDFQRFAVLDNVCACFHWVLELRLRESEEGLEGRPTGPLRNPFFEEFLGCTDAVPESFF